MSAAASPAIRHDARTVSPVRTSVPVFAFAVLFALASACMTSPRPELLAVARSPRGVTGEIRLVGQRKPVIVELLEVRATAYVTLHGARVAIVPFRDVEDASFETVGYVTTSRGHVPSMKARARLRLLSRYPFGMPDTAMSELLRAGGQDAPGSLLSAPRP